MHIFVEVEFAPSTGGTSTEYGLGGHMLRHLFRNQNSPLRLSRTKEDDPQDRNFEVSLPVTSAGVFVWYRHEPNFTNRQHHSNLTPFGVSLELGLRLVEQVQSIHMGKHEIFLGLSGTIEDVDAFDEQLVRTIGRASGKQHVMLLAA